MYYINVNELNCFPLSYKKKIYLAFGKATTNLGGDERMNNYYLKILCRNNSIKFISSIYNGGYVWFEHAYYQGSFYDTPLSIIPN